MPNEDSVQSAGMPNYHDGFHLRQGVENSPTGERCAMLAEEAAREFYRERLAEIDDVIRIRRQHRQMVRNWIARLFLWMFHLLRYSNIATPLALAKASLFLICGALSILLPALFSWVFLGTIFTWITPVFGIGGYICIGLGVFFLNQDSRTTHEERHWTLCGRW